MLNDRQIVRNKQIGQAKLFLEVFKDVENLGLDRNIQQGLSSLVGGETRLESDVLDGTVPPFQPYSGQKQDTVPRGFLKKTHESDSVGTKNNALLDRLSQHIGWSSLGQPPP